MPELPEVETIKRDLLGRLPGRVIEGVSVKDAMVVRSSSPGLFEKGIAGRKVTGVERRGKAVILKLSGDFSLVIQLVMTGQLVFGRKSPQARVSFRLSGGEYLNYNDQRRFGRLTLVRDLEELKFFRSLGPEPLSGAFNLKWFRKHLKKHKAPIKSLLMNQNFVAGIGNIYASEILFRCGIKPSRPADTLTSGEAAILRKTTVGVLREAIRFRGSSIHTYRDTKGEKGFFINRIKVYGKEKEECVSSCEEGVEEEVGLFFNSPILLLSFYYYSPFFYLRYEKTFRIIILRPDS